MKWILIILLFAQLFVLGIKPLTAVTYDIGLHLVLGKIAVTEHHVVKTNYFSYTNPNFPWGNNHWFSKVLLYLGHLYVGLKGLIVIKSVTITLAFILAFFAFFRKETLFFSIGVGLLTIFILIQRLDIRPEMFSYLLLGWYLFVLFKKPDSRLLWSLPIVQLLWVNTHILFFLGPLVYTLFLLGHYVEKKTITKNQIYVGSLIFISNVVSPYGFTGALYPFKVFDNYGLVISENLPTFSREVLAVNPTLFSYAFGLGILVAIISFIANYKNIKSNISAFLYSEPV